MRIVVIAEIALLLLFILRYAVSTKKLQGLFLIITQTLSTVTTFAICEYKGSILDLKCLRFSHKQACQHHNFYSLSITISVVAARCKIMNSI